MMRGYASVAAYWVATFRGELDQEELKVFQRALENTEVEDAVSAIDEIASMGGFPPTPQRIAELAEEHRKKRARKRIEGEKVAALPEGKRHVRFVEFLRDNPDMRERVSMVDVPKPGTPTNPIRGVLAEWLRQGL
jgi:hypothetical protein